MAGIFDFLLAAHKQKNMRVGTPTLFKTNRHFVYLSNPVSATMPGDGKSRNIQIFDHDIYGGNLPPGTEPRLSSAGGGSVDPRGVIVKNFRPGSGGAQPAAVYAQNRLRESKLSDSLSTTMNSGGPLPCATCGGNGSGASPDNGGGSGNLPQVSTNCPSGTSWNGKYCAPDITEGAL